MAEEGSLIIVGGHEDRLEDRLILREIAARVTGGTLVIATVASHQPDGYFAMYQRGFEGLGVGNLVELYVHNREEAASSDKLKLLEGAAGVFFTGGDQLRITSQLARTKLLDRVIKLHRGGVLIAGTSAGAAAMSELMLAGGPGGESCRLGELRITPGLSLLPGTIIDQHFAERGRFGRLLGAVAHDPTMLGLGIDEDTAIIVENGQGAVIGRGAVYVVDATSLEHSNVAEAEADGALSMFGVTLHVLSHGDSFDFTARRPHHD